MTHEANPTRPGNELTDAQRGEITAGEIDDAPAGAFVVGVDGSPAARDALAWAVAEATRHGLPLHLLASREVYVGAPHLDSSIAWSGSALDALDATVEILARDVARVREAAPDLPLTWSRPWGRPARHLVTASRDASVVVVGSRGQGRLAGALLGTVSLQTASNAHGPVLVVRQGQAPHPSSGGLRVAVGVDGSHDSREALRFALRLAGRGGRVVLVHAWWLEVVEGAVVTERESPHWETAAAHHEHVVDDIAEEFADLVAETGARLDRVVERARAEDALLDAAAEADVVVLGSRGRGGFAGLLLGSVSQHLLGVSPCPVAILRHRG